MMLYSSRYKAADPHGLYVLILAGIVILVAVTLGVLAAILLRGLSLLLS